MVRRRQLLDDDASLRFEALRQVSIGIERDAVWPQLSHLMDRSGKRLRGLFGQAVDQIRVDRFEADLARGKHQVPNRLEGLHPVHSLLNISIEILHAKAQAVEPELGKVAQAIGRGRARIDLDRHLGTGRQAESPAQHRHQTAEFGVAEESGRTATQMQLGHRLPATQHRHIERHLLRQYLQVLGGSLMVFGDHLVAGAVVTHRFTERDVHIDRQRWFATDNRPRYPMGQRLRVIRRAKGLDESVCGGIRGVARARSIQATQHRLGQHRNLVGSGLQHRSDCAKLNRSHLDLAQAAPAQLLEQWPGLADRVQQVGCRRYITN